MWLIERQMQTRRHIVTPICLDTIDTQILEWE